MQFLCKIRWVVGNSSIYYRKEHILMLHNEGKRTEKMETTAKCFNWKSSPPLQSAVVHSLPHPSVICWIWALQITKFHSLLSFASLSLSHSQPTFYCWSIKNKRNFLMNQFKVCDLAKFNMKKFDPSQSLSWLLVQNLLLSSLSSCVLMKICKWQIYVNGWSSKIECGGKKVQNKRDNSPHSAILQAINFIYYSTSHPKHSLSSSLALIDSLANYTVLCLIFTWHTKF